MPTTRAKQTRSTSVDAITHGDKRTNLPTADAQDFVAPEIEQPVPVRYARDPSLDPQLVWKGKDALDSEDLVVDAPPIYIQEKVDPRALVADLRRTAARPEAPLTLFDSFDGLPELDLVDFYQHQANWSNRMILGDSLNVMASLAEREALRGKVQMVYLDPPYGIKFGSNWQVSARKRDVKDGRIEDASREVEQIKAFRDTWELGIHSYLTYLRDRLAAARELLTESGSCFVQIGDENVHLVRSLMDEVFGSANFIALIPFRKKTMPFGTTFVEQMADFIVWYARDKPTAKYRKLFRREASALGFNQVDIPGKGRMSLAQAKREYHSLPEGTRLWTSKSLEPSGVMETGRYRVTLAGKEYDHPKNGYATDVDGMRRLAAADRLVPAGSLVRYVLFADDKPFGDLTIPWNDTVGADDKRYVVQTSTRVIERCMLMTTDPGDLILDPTCGSGTAAYVAEQWGRRWITVDTSRVALALARQRIMAASFPYYLLADSQEGRAQESLLSAEALPLADVTNDIRHGFVYERSPHITLGAIANNPDIKEGMSREDVDAAIRRHAEFDMLYDKPYEDKKKVRVAGPFTVESLSPHRALAFAHGSGNGGAAENATRADTNLTAESSFEQSVLANLRTAGIQNGRKRERLSFTSVEPYAGSYIQAIGAREVAAEGTPRRVAIALGPQYGVAGPAFIKDAALEAIRDDGKDKIDLLCILAFAFDPTVLGTNEEFVASDEGFANVAGERRLGRVPVLLVRMNSDLVMGEELKKTGVGNLFTVFGEPDIEITTEEDKLRVLLRGVDVYDPNTGVIRSGGTSQIALWMIDTSYDGESFFVRHCYFTGGQDPCARLKKALKADIDEESWASLYRTKSRLFDRPETGKIAVKVINDYGDEVMKVFTV